MRNKKLDKYQKYILQEIKIELNIIDKILLYALKKYTYKIYKIGIVDGYNKKNK